MKSRITCLKNIFKVSPFFQMKLELGPKLEIWDMVPCKVMLTCLKDSMYWFIKLSKRSLAKKLKVKKKRIKSAFLPIKAFIPNFTQMR